MIRTYTTHSVDETIALGERLGSVVRGGETIELRSDVGGGKTTFVKGVARGMKIAEVVQSPTFTISREYTAPSGLALHHYDFYRLNDPGILSAELSESVADKRVITIIEWADMVESVLPEGKIEITVRATGDDDREFTFSVAADHAYLLPAGENE